MRERIEFRAESAFTGDDDARVIIHMDDTYAAPRINISATGDLSPRGARALANELVRLADKLKPHC